MNSSVIATVMLFLAAVSGIAATVPVLGTAESFAVLGGSTVTNVPALGTNITGNLGVYPGTAVTGFQPVEPNTGIVTGTIYANDGVAQQAQVDLTKAYTALSLLAHPLTNNLTGVDLGNYHSGGGGLGALAPGVYHFDSVAAITGTLQLDAQNTDGAYWVFQIPTTLTTADGNSFVNVINDSVPGHTGVFWVVDTATLGTGTTFKGNILAQTSITMTAGASILKGSALAQTAAVTLDTNSISLGFSGGLVFADESSTTLVPIGTIPEPSTLVLLGLGIATLCGYGRRKVAAGVC